ncbi:MAG TPA: hypothetical protein VEQ66_16695 [Propionibacteriaceae bacterium]|nr:hypothetical protein [Propionibacteriaceae bacterium]
MPSAILGAGAVAAFARRAGLRVGAALLSAGSFLLIPIVALQVGTQANDLMGASFVLGAMALAAAPPKDWTIPRVGLIGLALGLGAATKLVALPAVAVVVIFAAYVLIREAKSSLPRARAAVLGMSLFTLVVAPWWLRNLARQGNPIYPQALPVLGRGVDVSEFGGIDSAMVGRKFLWPAYPLLEGIGDRSGFGAMLCVALLPGAVWAVRRARRRPLVLLIGASVGLLPFWWRYTLHEPRFFLTQVGLALICIPFALMAMSPRYRLWASRLLGITAVLTALLALDQQIAPLAQQPVRRGAFYERLFAVDAYVVENLPEDQGLLQVTGYGLPHADYASTYPLLGPAQKRKLVSLDAGDIGMSSDLIVQRMQEHGLRYIYVSAVPQQRVLVERLFEAQRFRLVRVSASAEAERRTGNQRTYRQVSILEAADVRRYLFELVG